MSAFSSHSEARTPSTPIRSTAEILAYAVHNIGCWPEDSVAIVSASDHQMGPVIRFSTEIDTVDEEQTASVLTHYLNLLPERLEADGQVLTKFFLVVFGKAGEKRISQTSCSNSLPGMVDFEDDAEAADRAEGWIQAGIEASQRTVLSLADIFYVGEVSRWELNEDSPSFRFSGFISDVLETPLYTDLTMCGSVVAPDEETALKLQGFKGESTMHPKDSAKWCEETSMWMEQFIFSINRSSTGYCADYLAQKFAEVSLWDRTREVVGEQLVLPLNEDEQKHRDATYADRIRQQVPPEIAGFLIASLSSAASGQFVLFAAAESLEFLKRFMQVLANSEIVDHQQPEVPTLLLPMVVHGGGVLAEKAEELSVHPVTFSYQPLSTDELVSDRFGKLMMGQTTFAPNWDSIRALDSLLSVISQCAEDEEFARIQILRAWIAWFRGSSTLAGDYLKQIEESVTKEDTPLALLLESSMLPLWMSDPVQSWKKDGWNS